MEMRCHTSPSPRATWLLLVMICLGVGACRRGVPIIDMAPKPVQAQGTISGTVRGPEGTSSIEGRTIEVINLATNQRERATTNSAGGFTLKLDPGKYRVELQLREGEALVKQPGVIELNRSDVDAHADFVVGPSRVSRPRHPAPRGDDGLGSAIA